MPLWTCWHGCKLLWGFSYTCASRALLGLTPRGSRPATYKHAFKEWALNLYDHNYSIYWEAGAWTDCCSWNNGVCVCVYLSFISSIWHKDIEHFMRKYYSGTLVQYCRTLPFLIQSFLSEDDLYLGILVCCSHLLDSAAQHPQIWLQTSSAVPTAALLPSSSSGISDYMSPLIDPVVS